MTGTKLELLINSLASGTQVFNQGDELNGGGSHSRMHVDEVGVVLGD